MAAALEHHRQVQAVSLASRQLRDALLLVAALEVERRDVAARLHRPDCDPQRVRAARDRLPDGALAIEGVTALVDVGELHRLADPQGAGVGLLLADDHPKECRLAGAVRADDADDPAARQLEREPLDQRAVPRSLADLDSLTHDL